jgi:N-methylhydantoinase A
LLSTRRGRDIREYAVIASGGGGAIHAAEVAADLSAKRVIVPPFPGHFSAWGMLMADLRHDLVQTGLTAASESDIDEPTAVFIDLERRMSDTFTDERVDPSTVVFARFADMRYRGQEHTVRVPIPSGQITADEWPSVLDQFGDMHEQQYTFRLDNAVEIVNFRVTGVSSVPKPSLAEVGPRGDVAQARKGSRQIDFGLRGVHEVTVYDRNRLGSDAVLDGPAAIEETATTTIVPPGQRVTVDHLGNLIIERQN